MTKHATCLVSALILFGSASTAVAQGAPQAVVDDGFGSLLGASNCIVAGEILVTKGGGAKEAEEIAAAWRAILGQLDAGSGKGEKVLAAAKASYGKYGDTPA